MQDEVKKVQSGMSLDINFERSRAKEEVVINSNDLLPKMVNVVW